MRTSSPKHDSDSWRSIQSAPCNPPRPKNTNSQTRHKANEGLHRSQKNSGSIPTVSRDHPGCGNNRLPLKPNKAQPKCQSVSPGKGAKVEIGRMQCPLMRSPRAATSPLQVKTRQITGQIGLTKVYDCVSVRDGAKPEAQCQRSISANGCPHRARCASIVR